MSIFVTNETYLFFAIVYFGHSIACAMMLVILDTLIVIVLGSKIVTYLLFICLFYFNFIYYE